MENKHVSGYDLIYVNELKHETIYYPNLLDDK
jgi:hypothetical protein